MKYFQYLLYLLIHIIAFLIVSRLRLGVLIEKARNYDAALALSSFFSSAENPSIKIGRNKT